MPMNKKEQAEMQRLRDDLALARAMRWPDYPKPAAITLEQIKANLVDGGIRYGHAQKVARGWFYNAFSQSLSYGCSDGHFHDRNGDTTSTQQIGYMFATKADAARALRCDLTIEYATKLAAVDRIIAEAEAE